MLPRLPFQRAFLKDGTDQTVFRDRHAFRINLFPSTIDATIVSPLILLFLPFLLPSGLFLSFALSPSRVCNLTIIGQLSRLVSLGTVRHCGEIFFFQILTRRLFKSYRYFDCDLLKRGNRLLNFNAYNRLRSTA